MIESNALKPVAHKTINELTDSHTVIDVGQRTHKTIQKIALAIIIVLVVVLILNAIIVIPTKP